MSTDVRPDICKYQMHANMTVEAGFKSAPTSLHSDRAESVEEIDARALHPSTQPVLRQPAILKIPPMGAQDIRLPLMPTVTCLNGRSAPLDRIAWPAMYASPEQQGTSMWTTVRLFIPE